MVWTFKIWTQIHHSPLTEIHHWAHDNPFHQNLFAIIDLAQMTQTTKSQAIHCCEERLEKRSKISWMRCPSTRTGVDGWLHSSCWMNGRLPLPCWTKGAFLTPRDHHGFYFDCHDIKLRFVSMSQPQYFTYIVKIMWNYWNIEIAIILCCLVGFQCFAMLFNYFRDLTCWCRAVCCHMLHHGTTSSIIVLQRYSTSYAVIAARPSQGGHSTKSYFERSSWFPGPIWQANTHHRL